MKASCQAVDVTVGYQRIRLEPGQFIFGRIQAARELKMTERQIRTCQTSLISTGNVSVKTTNKYSIITVVNWHSYQSVTTDNDSQNVTPPARQASSNRPQTRSKEVKNIKPIVAPLLPICEAWKAFTEMREKIKKPMTGRAMELIASKLVSLQNQGHDPVAVLENSIINSWQGVHPLKHGQTPPEQQRTATPDYMTDPAYEVEHDAA